MTNPDPSDGTLFAAALERPGPERAAYLDSACTGDPRIPGFLLSPHSPMKTDHPATTPDQKQPRDLLPKAPCAITSNLWNFLLWGALAANQAFGNLQKPLDRFLLFMWSLLAVWSAILACQERLKQRICKLLDCLEHTNPHHARFNSQLRPDRISAAGLLLLPLAMLVTSLHAQSPILNDTFADGERVTQNLPTSVAWRVSTTQAGALTVRNGALDLTVANNGRTVWAYFPKTSLQVGESITLTIDFSVTELPLAGVGSGGLRFGLCYTNGVVPLNSDGPRPEGNYQGYAIESAPNSRRASLNKRNGPAAPMSSLIGTFANDADDPPSTVVWNTLGAARINGIAQANTPYTVVLKIMRTGPDAAGVTQSISGAGLTLATNTATVPDSSNIFSNFDTVALYAPDGLSGVMRITRVNLTATTLAAITNLSILTNISAADPFFTVGTVIGGAGTSGTKALLIRAAGPSLAALGVGGTLADSKLEIFSGQTVTAANDNWGGTPALSTAFAQVGAFAYSSTASKDAAVFNPALAAGGYTVQVSGVGGATGSVIAELYDSTPASEFIATTPRLINVSVLKQINAGEILTAGFVISGSASKQVLIRAVGPTLGAAPFNIPGVMADPKLDLFSGQTVINSNNDWGGGATLAAAFTSVGAFALPAASKDAALLVTLAPGNYTAQATAVGNSGGLALVEVYEVP